jgi:peptide/nickel transport system substrate-binding protein
MLALLVVLSMLFTACAQPVPVAPEAAAPAAEGAAPAASGSAAAAGEAEQGGVWTRVASSDAGNLNPILSDNTASSDVMYLLYDVALVGGDLETGALTCDGALCESWEVSDDGLVYTFPLKDGFNWNDGTPVTAQDFVYTYNAINSDLVESPRKYVWDSIESIEAPDDKTVVITYNNLRCDALYDLGNPLMPAHIFADTVSSGPFNFQSWQRDDNLIVARNDNYYQGAPNMDGMIYRVVPDAGTRLAMLQSKESDILRVQPNQIATVDQNPDLARYTWEDDGYTYIGLNLANPENPQNGRDENGEVIPQEPHPILGDKAVRQAIATALDYESIINDIFLGQGFRQVSNVMPAVTWAYDDTLAPYTFDVDAANALLEGAGWVDSDGDGVREKDGVEMQLDLITNAGNTTRVDLGTYVQDALSNIGIQVDFQAVDFGTMLEQMDAQTYDMYIIGWTGLGPDPATDYPFFHSGDDVVGSGFNNVSYYNADVEEAMDLGRAVPGCALEDRAPYYKQIQAQIKEDVPYIFITGSQSNIAYNSRWEGIDPKPWAASEPVYWNTHEWFLKDLTQ